MNFFITSIIIVISIICILAIVNQFITRSVRTEILINASKEKVWDVLMEHEAYSEWNPFIPKINIKGENSDRISMIILADNGDILIPEKEAFDGHILSNMKYEKFSWGNKGFITNIIGAEHYFLLEPVGNKQTKFIHGETFEGLFLGIVASVLFKKAGKQYEALNKALKARVEHK